MPTPLVSRARSRLQVDDGYSLVELVVVMLVAGIMLTLFVPFIGAVGRASQTTLGLQQATGSGRILLQSIETQVSSASQVCLLGSSSGGAPTPSTACPSSVSPPYDGLQVLTDAYGSEHYVQWWYQSGSPGKLLEQRWPAGETPPAPTVSVVVGSTSTQGLVTCSVVDPGAAGLFSLPSPNESTRTRVAISFDVSCASGQQTSMVAMTSTATAWDTSS